MADIYLDSVAGDDANDGTSWALAKATLAGALAVMVAGDTLFASHEHSENPGAITYTVPGTITDPCWMLSANKGTGALAAGASVVTGNAAISINGSFYCSGFTISTTASNRALTLCFASEVAFQYYEDCVLGGGRLLIGRNVAQVDSQSVFWKNVRFRSFANDDNLHILVNGTLHWIDTPDVVLNAGHATAPPILRANPDLGGMNRFHGENLGFQNVTTAVSVMAGNNDARLSFQNCRLPASVPLASGTFSNYHQVIEGVNCSSGATNYEFEKTTLAGKVTQETTIVRTGGATDGTTPVSRKMASTASARFFAPLESSDLCAWNEDTGTAKTITAHIVTDGVTLTDGDCWLEVSGLDDASYPAGTKYSDRMANVLSTPVDHAASTETWTTTGLTTPVKQKLEVTFTPMMKGPVKARVMMAKPSTTVYVCPKVECS